MPDLRQLLRKPVVYSVPGMEHVHVRKNVVYKTVAGDQLRLDVCYPPDLRPGVAFPAVIFIYGDGPPDILKEVKDAGQYVCWGQLIAASGLIGVTFQHRSSKSYTCLHEVAGDIDDLITYVRTQEEELQIDADRLGI